MKIIPEVAAPSHVQYGRKLTDVPLGMGIESIAELEVEFAGYANILLGRALAPVEAPYLELAEVASAYYARGQEVDMLIHNEERKRNVIRGHPLYLFRTGSLRAFLEMSKRMAELGSRRLTQERLLFEQRIDAGENY